MPDPKNPTPANPPTPAGPVVDPLPPVTPGGGPDPAGGAPVALTPANPTVTTNAPASSVAVTVPNASGKVTFQLVVTDNLGVQSAPVFASVVIQGPPTGVINATPTVVQTGGTIQLNGKDSSSTGSIASYTFTLVPPSAAPPVG